MAINAVIFGATGMVGEGVLHEALRDPAVGSVLAIGRRSCGVAHPKLQEIMHSDFLDYAAIEPRLRGYDACFFCLGSTSIGKNEDEYRRITYDFALAAATTLARLDPAMTFCYVSGAGTDTSEQGRTMWARVKGKTENDLMKLPFRAVYVFRPGFIKPTPGLKNAFLVSKIIAPAYPLLEVVFPNWMSTLEDVGRSMIRVATGGYTNKILECWDIATLARSAA